MYEQILNGHNTRLKNNMFITRGWGNTWEKNERLNSRKKWERSKKNKFYMSILLERGVHNSW
jgi:hypothetical protein